MSHNFYNAGKWRGTVDVAIKQLKSLDPETMRGSDVVGFEKAQKEFFKECNILRILHHPHLVQVIQNLVPASQQYFN